MAPAGCRRRTASSTDSPARARPRPGRGPRTADGLGPGDDDAGGAIDQPPLQDGGRGVVRIAVQADRLRFHLLGDARQRLDRASMIGLPPPPCGARSPPARPARGRCERSPPGSPSPCRPSSRRCVVKMPPCARSGRRTSITSCVLAARRRVGQPGGHADGAGLQRLFHPRAHDGDLGRRSLAFQVRHRGHAQRDVAQQHGAVGRRRCSRRACR